MRSNQAKRAQVSLVGAKQTIKPWNGVSCWGILGMSQPCDRAVRAINDEIPQSYLLLTYLGSWVWGLESIVSVAPDRS